MRCEKLYENCGIECLFTCSNALFLLKMNNIHDSVTSHHTENLWKTFCFAYISTSENDRILSFVLKDLSSKTVQKLYAPILMLNQERLPNIFNMMGSDTMSCRLFILSKRKSIRTRKKEFNPTVFIELFTAHILESNSRFYHLLNLRYMRIKKCYNITNIL
jgi:hypothetical protein